MRKKKKLIVTGCAQECGVLIIYLYTYLYIVGFHQMIKANRWERDL
jgi:hypothetical protein